VEFGFGLRLWKRCRPLQAATGSSNRAKLNGTATRVAMKQAMKPRTSPWHFTHREKKTAARAVSKYSTVKEHSHSMVSAYAILSASPAEKFHFCVSFKRQMGTIRWLLQEKLDRLTGKTFSG